MLSHRMQATSEALHKHVLGSCKVRRIRQQNLLHVLLPQSCKHPGLEQESGALTEGHSFRSDWVVKCATVRYKQLQCLPRRTFPAGLSWRTSWLAGIQRLTSSPGTCGKVNKMYQARGRVCGFVCHMAVFTGTTAFHGPLHQSKQLWLSHLVRLNAPGTCAQQTIRLDPYQLFIIIHDMMDTVHCWMAPMWNSRGFWYGQ
jgi:hypothetical protein